MFVLFTRINPHDLFKRLHLCLEMHSAVFHPDGHVSPNDGVDDDDDDDL